MIWKLMMVYVWSQDGWVIEAVYKILIFGYTMILKYLILTWNINGGGII